MAADVVLVGRGTSVGSAANVSTTAGAVTAGRPIFLAVSYDPGVSISGNPSDTAGNTYGTPTITNTGDAKQAVWVVENALGHASNVATVAFTGAAFATAHLHEVTGAANPAYDSAATTTAAPTVTPPWTGTSGTLAQADSVVVSFTEGNQNGTSGAYSVSGGTFAITSQESDAILYWTSAVAKQVVSATTAVTATWSKTGEGSSGVPRGVIMLAFKAATAGGMSGSIPLALAVTGALRGQGALVGSVPMALGVTGTLNDATPPAFPAFLGAFAKEMRIEGWFGGTAPGSIPNIAAWFDPYVMGAAQPTGALSGAIALALGVSGQLRGQGALVGAVPLTLGVSGTLTNASTIGHALGFEFLGSSGVSTSTPSFTTQATGSALLVSVGRGVLDDFPLTTITDNKGNTLALVDGEHAYTNWATSGTALYGDLTAAGGSGHVVTASLDSINDECTVVAVEVPGVNAIVDKQWSQNNTTTVGVAPTSTTSPNVTTTGAAKLVAFWWGDNPNGEDNPADLTGAWTRLDFTNSTASNHVQAASFYREVSAAGTYSITVTPNIPQGAQIYIVALQQVSPMAGAIALALGVSGQLRGQGALVGAVPLSLGVVGLLRGQGALLGSIPLSLTVNGVATGQGALVGSVPMALGVTGALGGSGAMLGSIPLTLTPAGTLTAAGSGAMSGAVPLSLTVTGAATGQGALVGSVPLSLSVSGVLAGQGALLGSIPLSMTPAGVLTNNASGAITGNVAITLGVAGTLGGSGGMLGNITATLTPSGALTGRGAMQGLASMSFTITGALTDPAAAINGLRSFTLSALRSRPLVAGAESRKLAPGRTGNRTLH